MKCVAFVSSNLHPVSIFYLPGSAGPWDSPSPSHENAGLRGKRAGLQSEAGVLTGARTRKPSGGIKGEVKGRVLGREEPVSAVSRAEHWGS